MKTLRNKVQNIFRSKGYEFWLLGQPLIDALKQTGLSYCS